MLLIAQLLYFNKFCFKIKLKNIFLTFLNKIKHIICKLEKWNRKYIKVEYIISLYNCLQNKELPIQNFIFNPIKNVKVIQSFCLNMLLD